MLGRFGVGLVKGLLVGSLLLAGLLFGLKVLAVPVWAAYLLAMGAGVLTGLIAGRPIWQKEARIEAGLKAAAGLVLGAIGFFAINKWGHALVAPEALRSLPGVAPAPAGAPALTGAGLVFLPVLTTVLGLLFELDNTPAPDDKKSEPGEPPAAGGPRARVSSHVPSPEEIDELLDTTAPPQQQRRTKR